MFRDGRIEEALRGFRALARLGDEYGKAARVRFNIARCLEDLGRIQEAVEAYQRYLEWSDDPKAQKRARVRLERLLGEYFGELEVRCHDERIMLKLEGPLEPHHPCPAEWSRVIKGTHPLVVMHENLEIQRISVTIEPGGRHSVTIPKHPRLSVISTVAHASVFVNSEPWGSAPAPPRLVAPGVARIVVRAEGHREWTTQVELEPGEHREIRATPAPLEVKVEVQPVPPPIDEPPRDRTWPWVVTGSGITLLGAGLVFLYLNSQWNDQYDQTGTASDKEKTELYRDLTYASYTVGGLLTAGGATWLLWPDTGRGNDSSETRQAGARWRLGVAFDW